MSDLKQTDLSKRLRQTIERGIDANGMRTLLAQAADEIERYYTGMLNWKATAEAQSRTQPEATKPAQDLGAAILALPLPGGSAASTFGAEEHVYSAWQMRELLKAAAALASPADALVAGDRVDLENWNTQMAGVKALLECTEGELECIDGKLLKDYVEHVKRIYAAIQAQKDGHG